MPSRNIVKSDIPNSYYHIYTRGTNKQRIFLDGSDYVYFCRLLERYLSSSVGLSSTGVAYPNYRGSIELLCYCQMSNHFHLLVHQIEKGAMTMLMRSLMTSYSRYFNLKYKRTGAVFESRYKASRIDQHSYLEHISRYIHMNPRYWKTFKHSSIAYYTKTNIMIPEWLNVERILGLFGSSDEYIMFMEDYDDTKLMLDEIKSELADQ